VTFHFVRLAVHALEFHRWPASVFVTLQLPPRQSLREFSSLLPEEEKAKFTMDGDIRIRTDSLSGSIRPLRSNQRKT